MRGAAAFSSFATVVAIAAFGCAEKPTSISVHTTTTVACADLKGVSFLASAPGALDGHSLITTQCVDEEPAARIGTVVLLPSGAKDAVVSIRIVAGVDKPAGECDAASGYAGCIVARRVVPFVPNHEIDIHVALRTECRNHACDGASTCVAGECRSSEITDPASCEGTTCSEDALGPRPGPPAGPGDPTAGTDAGQDGGAVTPPITEAGVPCGASEKVCGGRCVGGADPAFGCTPTSCSPCTGFDSGDYACSNNACVLLQCKAGNKKCGDTCIAGDITNGCGGPECKPCNAGNGVASCGTDGACQLKCNDGYKLCGGQCVSVDDPTYGCTATGCSNSACPNPGSSGTLVCQGGVCQIGTCNNGTKDCNQRCVPTDANNGCEASGCGACPAGNVCQGAPTVCTCVPQPLSTTCQGKSCGSAIDNCGQTVQCPDQCTPPNSCGAGGAGPNGCGCNADAISTTCAGIACGPATNNCGQGITCPTTCAPPNTCGGGGSGANGCGCTITLDCAAIPLRCGYFDNGCGTQVYCCRGQQIG